MCPTVCGNILVGHQGSQGFRVVLGRVLALPGLQHHRATPGATTQAGVWGWGHPWFPPEAINQRGAGLELSSDSLAGSAVCTEPCRALDASWRFMGVCRAHGSRSELGARRFQGILAALGVLGGPVWSEENAPRAHPPAQPPWERLGKTTPKR